MIGKIEGDVSMNIFNDNEQNKCNPKYTQYSDIRIQMGKREWEEDIDVDKPRERKCLESRIRTRVYK